MRLANLAGRAVLAVGDGRYVDVAKASDGRFGSELATLYEQWDVFIAAAPSLLETGEAITEDDALLGPPSPAPRQVFAIGTNYRTHSAETGAELPKKPATFTKYPTCLTGPYSPVHLPPRGMVDWEVELVAIIGRRASRVPEGDAWDYIAGLTVGQDISERWLQRAAGRQFALGKSYPGFGPTGPWLVTLDEIEDPGDLALGCDVNGESMQDGRTSEMIFSVPTLIAELSAVVPLLPGDVIFTGTPGGVGGARTPPVFLQAGQTLHSWIEGIGSLRNQILPRHEAAHRTGSEEGNRPDVQQALDLAIGSTAAENVFRTLARNPGLYVRYAGFAGKLFVGGKLSIRDRELVILRVAWLCRSEYEWAQHARIARDAGFSADEIGGVGAGASAACWDVWDAALLRATEEFVTDHTVSQPSWDALARRYDDPQMIEFLLLAGSYVMLAGVLNAAGVEIEPGYTGWPTT